MSCPYTLSISNISSTNPAACLAAITKKSDIIGEGMTVVDGMIVFLPEDPHGTWNNSEEEVKDVIAFYLKEGTTCLIEWDHPEGQGGYLIGNNEVHDLIYEPFVIFAGENLPLDDAKRKLEGEKIVSEKEIIKTLVEACDQARAALPDAWFAVKCQVPREVVTLLDNAILLAEGKHSPADIGYRSSWEFHSHGDHYFFATQDWTEEVACGDTILGYQEWVEHRLDMLLHDIDLEGVDTIEVNSVVETGEINADGKKVVEVTFGEEVSFFSVYTHKQGEGVECQADFNTKGQALEFARALAARAGIPVFGLHSKYYCYEIATIDGLDCLWADLSEVGRDTRFKAEMDINPEDVETYAIGTCHATSVGEALDCIRSGNWQYTQKN